MSSCRRLPLALARPLMLGSSSGAFEMLARLRSDFVADYRDGDFPAGRPPFPIPAAQLAFHGLPPLCCQQRYETPRWDG